MPKLYLSQANQGHNAGKLGYIEKAGMDAIIHATLKEFEADTRWHVYHTKAGDRIDTAEANCEEANRLNVDWYVAVHSNAGGAGAQGTIGFYYSMKSKGFGMAKAIVGAVGPLSPGAHDGLVQRPDFIEVHRPKAPACLIELDAHDWEIGVKWLTGQRPKIARALYVGICKGAGLRPLDVVAPLDYRPLKVAAVKVAEALKLPHDGVSVDANSKGAPFATLLRAIADHQ